MKSKVSVIIMSLLIIVSISSFLWGKLLIETVEYGHATHSELTHVSQLGLDTLLYKRFNTYETGDKRWINIAKVLAKTDGEVAFKLAKYYIDKQDKNYKGNRNTELWLKQAVRLGHNKAKVMLASLYIDDNKLTAAKILLLKIKYDISALKLLIKISVIMGKNSDVEYYSQLYANIVSVTRNKEDQIFYQKLEQYKVIDTPDVEAKINCLATIAPFATNLDNLTYLDKLISSSTLDPLKPYICFSPVKYISKLDLDCLHKENEAIQCNESIWANNHSALKNRFVAVLVEKGGANVNSGILYIDSDDNEDVFFHELAHLLGFIDEYPLPKNHFRCLAVQDSMFSHNIAVLPRFYKGSRETVREEILRKLPWARYISRSTKLVTKTAEGWEIGTKINGKGIVGAFIAESCDGISFVSIKPLKQRTAMRYFEEEFPAFYLKMLADNPDKFLMPHYL
jgi:hypothetical protein